MARKRKTLPIAEILSTANEKLADQTIKQDIKMGICVFLETLLHDTGNYEGFQYLTWTDGGFSDWVKAGQPDQPEKEYFITRNKETEYNRYYYTRNVSKIAYKKEFLNPRSL